MKGICKSCGREKELVECFDCYFKSISEKTQDIFEGTKLHKLELEIIMLRHKFEDLINIIKYKVDVSNNAIRAIDAMKEEHKDQKQEEVF